MDKYDLFRSVEDKEEKMFFSFIYDKIISGDKSGIPSFTDFCSPSQMETINTLFMRKFIDSGFVARIENSERKIPSVNFSYAKIPTDILCINGINSENVTHRDVLGAIMNLGIKRCKVGDIIIGEKVFVEVKNEITLYVISNLTRVAKQNVKVEIYEGDVARTYQFKESFLTVSSLRGDCLIGGIINLSREKSKELILSGAVTINSKPFLNPSKAVNEGDVISIRGSGKYLFSEILGETRKERLKIIIKKYI